MGEFTDANLDQWSEQLIQLLDSHADKLYVVSSIDPTLKLKANVTKHERSRILFRHPKMAWLVIVGGTPLVGFLMQSIQPFIKARLKTAPTLEDAIYFLRELRLIENERDQKKENNHAV
jgi:hypothetical protein